MMRQESKKTVSGSILVDRHDRRNHHRATAGLGLLAAFGISVACALSLGGCPGPETVIPITPGQGTVSTSNLAKVAPVVRFLEPADDNLEVTTGMIATITFTIKAVINESYYRILLDPDTITNNGNEIEVASGTSSSVPPSGLTIAVNTATIPNATYNIRSSVDYGGTAPAITNATGKLVVLPPGLLIPNRPPFSLCVEPLNVVNVIHGDSFTIRWCARDPDDQGRVLILLDNDDDPTNDVNFINAANAQFYCAGPFPMKVGNVIILACRDETDCPATATTQPAQMNQLDWVIDANVIPPRADGEYYRVRVDVTDQRNRAAHSYAPGGVAILPYLSTTLIDMQGIGRLISGAKFVGFDAGGRLGHSFTTVPDMNNDGTNEFVMVAQYGRPYEVGSVGSAYLLFGRPETRYGSSIPVSSIGASMTGTAFSMGRCSTTEGIHTVTYVPDLDNDGLVELLFGAPYIQQMMDTHDDSPCDKTGACYNRGMTIDPDGNIISLRTDLLPNPLDPAPSEGSIGDADRLESGICSNDQDLTVRTPIASGYMIYVPGSSLVDKSTATPTPRKTVIDLSGVGQSTTGSTPGARFRGAWYDFDLTQVDWPYAIVPTTRYGFTINSMPSVSNWGNFGGSIPDCPVSYVKWLTANSFSSGPYLDEPSEILVSAPQAEKERGQVILTFGQDMANFRPGTAENGNSIPHYYPVDCTPNYRGLDYPVFVMFTGSAPGDHLGYADSAGDFNQDGNQDVLMGAPGADRDGLVNAGIIYILFGRIDIGDIEFESMNPPRVEIHGIQPNEGLGAMNCKLNDVNGDGLPDIGFGDPNFSPNSLSNAGQVGIIFGGRYLTGENIFNVAQVGTNQLPGCRFLGTQPGGNAGMKISSAGDFNSDGFGDLLIVAPNETKVLNGQLRRGVCYLVFGGYHLYNKVFQLTEVGTQQLPGVTFVSPYAMGTADEATIESAESAGDVDGDGFGDILIGVPTADYIYPASPTQRRIDSGEAYLVYGTSVSGVGN